MAFSALLFSLSRLFSLSGAAGLSRRHSSASLKNQENLLDMINRPLVGDLLKSI